MARTGSDAQSILNVPIDDSDIGNGKVLAYNETTGNLEYETPAGGGDMTVAVYDPAGKAEQLLGISDLLDEDDMVSDSNTKGATQQSIKAYVDSVAGVPDGDKGDITVTAGVWTIDANAVTYAKIQDVSTTQRLLGRNTAGAGSIEELAPATVRTMLNVADGATANTGALADLDTVSATEIASNAVTTDKILNSNVTYAKMQNVSATDRLLGRSTAGAGTIEEVVCTSFARSILDDADAGTVRTTIGVDPAGTDNAPDASTTTKGKIEIATQAEVDTGTDTVRAVTPDTLAGSNIGSRVIVLQHTESDTAVATGDGTIGIPITAELNGMNIVDVQANVYTKGVTGTTDVQVRRQRGATDTDVLSTKVTVGDEYYASDGVINTSNDDLATGDMIFVDVDAVHSGTAPNGLSVAIVAQLP